MLVFWTIPTGRRRRRCIITARLNYLFKKLIRKPTTTQSLLVVYPSLGSYWHPTEPTADHKFVAAAKHCPIVFSLLSVKLGLNDFRG